MWTGRAGGQGVDRVGRGAGCGPGGQGGRVWTGRAGGQGVDRVGRGAGCGPGGQGVDRTGRGGEGVRVGAGRAVVGGRGAARLQMHSDGQRWLSGCPMIS